MEGQTLCKQTGSRIVYSKCPICFSSPVFIICRIIHSLISFLFVSDRGPEAKFQKIITLQITNFKTTKPGSDEKREENTWQE